MRTSRVPRISVRRPEPFDIFRLQAQPSQAIWGWDLVSAANLFGLFDETARTVLLDGEVKGMGGILATGEAWTLLAEDCREVMPVMLRVVKRMLEWHRLNKGSCWATMEEGIEAKSARMFRLLGFRSDGDIWRYG